MSDFKSTVSNVKSVSNPDDFPSEVSFFGKSYELHPGETLIFENDKVVFPNGDSIKNPDLSNITFASE